MPNKRIAMHKIHEILRLRFEVGLSFRQISQCADVSTGAIQKMLKRLEAAGISWPLPEGMSEPRLASLLYPESDSRPGALEDPDWAEIHMELRKKASPATCCGRNTARGCRFGRTATRSSAAAIRPGASHRNAPCASSILPVKNALSTIVDPQCRLSHLRRVNAGRPRSSWRCWAHQTTPSRRLPIRSRCQTGFSATSGCWSSSVESPKSWFRIT